MSHLKKFISAAILGFLACSFAFADSRSDFAEVQSVYFKTLDYTDPAVAARIPELERRMLKEVAEILAKPERERTKLDAQWLSYTAMYLINTNIGASQGYLDFAKLGSDLAFTSESDALSIRIAREQKSVDLLAASHLANPDDWRVTAWLLETRFGLKVIRKAPISDAEKKEFAESAKVNTFGFFGAYITASEVGYSDPALTAELDRSAVKLLHQKLPCGVEGRPEVCGNKPFAPHVTADALTILGDYFAKKYEAATTPEERKVQARRVKIAWTYASVPLITGSHDGWDALEAFRERKDAYFGGVPWGRKHFDWNSPNAKKVMACSACHTP